MPRLFKELSEESQKVAFDHWLNDIESHSSNLSEEIIQIMKQLLCVFPIRLTLFVYKNERFMYDYVFLGSDDLKNICGPSVFKYVYETVKTKAYKKIKKYSDVSTSYIVYERCSDISDIRSIYNFELDINDDLIKFLYYMFIEIICEQLDCLNNTTTLLEFIEECLDKCQEAIMFEFYNSSLSFDDFCKKMNTSNKLFYENGVKF